VWPSELKRARLQSLNSERITAYAEISAEPNLFKKIHEMADSTESAQEFPSVLSALESERVLGTAL
jgi:hypothetical protein